MTMNTSPADQQGALLSPIADPAAILAQMKPLLDQWSSFAPPSLSGMTPSAFAFMLPSMVAQNAAAHIMALGLAGAS